MKILESIDKADLEPVIAGHTGNRLFRDSLYRIENNSDLLCVLGRYIHFNSVFGSGVANLSGEIGCRQDLFREPNEEVTIISDRSVEVAANIFCAAIDEFGDLSIVQRNTHRTLAQATLKAAANFFGVTFMELNELTCPYEATLAAIGKIREGYGISQKMDETKIFRSIGFHIGSEVLADEEFNILDQFLRDKRPELVRFLEQTKVKINEIESGAYRWIQIHTTVEAEHFGAAVRAANLALRYYAGPESRVSVKKWIVDGIKEFAATQSQFMNNLMPAPA
jgi:hypothetical protein